MLLFSFISSKIPSIFLNFFENFSGENLRTPMVLTSPIFKKVLECVHILLNFFENFFRKNPRPPANVEVCETAAFKRVLK